MTDILLSSFLSLFALFGKEEQVDEAWAKSMLNNYLRRHLGIRNTDAYIGLYTDMRGAYEMTDDLDTLKVIDTICSNLYGKVSATETSLLVLRLMEFCLDDGKITAEKSFKMLTDRLNIPESQYSDFLDFVNNRPTNHVLLHHLKDTDGQLRTLLDRGPAC